MNLCRVIAATGVLCKNSFAEKVIWGLKVHEKRTFSRRRKKNRHILLPHKYAPLIHFQGSSRSWELERKNYHCLRFQKLLVVLVAYPRACMISAKSQTHRFCLLCATSAEFVLSLDLRTILKNWFMFGSLLFVATFHQFRQNLQSSEGILSRQGESCGVISCPSIRVWRFRGFKKN